MFSFQSGGGKGWFTPGRLKLIWLAVFGVAALLLMGQIAAPFMAGSRVPAAVSPTPAAAGQAAATPTDDFLLAEYDATAAPFLETETDDRPLWQISLDMGLKLAVVLGLIYVVVAGLRWLQRHRLNAAGQGVAIRVIETIGLAPGRSLHLVEVGHKTLLIGATDHQLSLLTDLSTPPPEALAEAAPVLADDELDDNQPLPEFEENLRWQVTLNGLRDNVQRIRDAVGGGPQ
jgi:flagellar biosynthetic protein FliO